MENLVLKGTITATSNKTGERYKTSEPRKTAYLTITDDQHKVAEEFGLKKYTSEDKDTFFIAKCSQNVTLYVNGNLAGEKNTGTEDKNFKTIGEVSINFVKGEKDGNTFIRLSAINTDNLENIEDVIPENPFADYITE